jgi:hypothetical protein
MAKGNQKAKRLATQEENILSGFDELIKLQDEMADHVEQTMPTVAQSIRLTVALLKQNKRAFNATKGKKA